VGFWVLGSVFVLGCFVGLGFSFVFLASFFVVLGVLVHISGVLRGVSCFL
jgi:hypothetical protein